MRIYASAGAVVVTGELRSPEILFLDQVRKNGEQQTVCPKGQIEPGESALGAALREVAEESGIKNLSYMAFLGRQSYSFDDMDSTPARKTVDWFLFHTPDRATSPAAAEGFTSARWVSAIEASQVASHALFGEMLERALDILAWRACAQPVSPVLDAFVRDLADSSVNILRAHPGSGVGLCGSAARGDFVDGWSDVDVIAWGIPAESGTSRLLTQLVTQASTVHAVSASLRLRGSGDAGDLAGPAKLSAVLTRTDREVAIIAGSLPDTTTLQTRPAAAEIAAISDALAEDLRNIPPEAMPRKRDIRRALSALTNAARIAAVTVDPDAGLRLSEVVETLADMLPEPLPLRLLRSYEQFRRAKGRDILGAEEIARQVPEALAVLVNFVNQKPAP